MWVFVYIPDKLELLSWNRLEAKFIQDNQNFQA